MSQSLNTKVDALTAEQGKLTAAIDAYEKSRDAADAKLAETISAQTAELERLRALPTDTTAAEASIQAAIDGMQAARQTLVAPTTPPAPVSPSLPTSGNTTALPSDPAA